MGDETEDALKQLVTTLRAFAEGQVKAAGRESIVPDWLKWTCAILALVIGGTVGSTNMSRDISEAAATAKKAVAILEAQDKKQTDQILEARKRMDIHIRREAARARAVYRKLDLPEPPDDDL